MTVTEAKKIRRDYYNMTNPTEEDRFLFTEALRFLIRETKDPDYMNDLGAEYYEQKDYDLALKYYEMAAEYDHMGAIGGLGYIWYYGRTGERNYEKAFYYYDKARRLGSTIAAYKVADMYRFGYYAEKDPERYREIIEDLYKRLRYSRWPGDPVPEVFTRLAAIRVSEGKTDEALQLYDDAREVLSRRIREHSFFGDRTIMKGLIRDVYQLRKINTDDISLYDLFYILQKPVKVYFRFEDREFMAESAEETGECSVRFEDRWYRTADDFFAEAEIDGVLLTTLYEELYDFRVIGWN